MASDIMEEIFSAVKAKMEDQGAYDRAAYEEFVDEAILDFERDGLLTGDDEIEAIKDKLMLRWNEARESFAEKES